MAKSKTHFDQVPLDMIPKTTRQTAIVPTLCRICGKAVLLENCKIDEEGVAVHARCYCEKVSRNNASRL
jgi:hypothetical protein